MTIPCPIEHPKRLIPELTHPANCPGGCGGTGLAPSPQALSGMGNSYEAALTYRSDRQAGRIVELEKQVKLLREVIAPLRHFVGELHAFPETVARVRPMLERLDAALAETKEKP